jgi:hypothetical protein
MDPPISFERRNFSRRLLVSSQYTHMLWLLLLPFRLAFGILAGLVVLPFLLIVLPFALLLWLPFAMVRMALRLVAGLLVLPIMLVALVVGPLAAGVGMALAVVPLLPVIVIALCIWAVVRLAGGTVRSSAI